MIKTEKISAIQLIALIVVNRFLFGFSFMPTVTISPANQDAWIVDLLTGLLIMIFAVPLLIISTKFKDLSFDEYFEIILGKPIGKTVNFIYAIYLFSISILAIVLLSDFITNSVLPETPMFAILAIMIIPCGYTAYKGIECIGRTAVILGIVVFLIIILYAILNANNMDFKTFLPILHDSTLSKIAFGIFNNASRFCDCFVFFLFIPYVKKTDKFSVTKILIIIVVSFTVMNTLITVATQAVLGTGLAKILKYPYFISIQQISLFNIIQRIEFFNVIGWIIIFFFKISSTFLTVAILLQRVFKVKSYKPFVVPMCIVAVLILLLTNISFYIVLRTIFIYIAYLIIFITNFVIPSIVLIVYLIRKESIQS